MKAHVQRLARSGESSFVYRVKADARFSRGWHFHSEFELTWIQSSQGRRFVGDTIENYRSGDLVLLGPNLPHTWRSEDTGEAHSGRRPLHRAIVIQFERDFLGSGFFALPEMTDIAILLGRASQGLHVGGRTRDEVARRMEAMLRKDRFGRLTELLNILRFLSEAGDDLRVICRTPLKPLFNRRDRVRIDRVFNHLHEHYTEPLTQAAMASLAGVSAAGFSRFFRKATGMTFVDYVAELRISHACQLLIDTDRSVLEISMRSGFNNLSNFNRKFARLKGVTPREYRARHAALA